MTAKTHLSARIPRSACSVAPAAQVPFPPASGERAAPRVPRAAPRGPQHPLSRRLVPPKPLAAAAERVGASHDGADRGESGEAKAGRIVREELRRRGWKEEDLPGRRKGDKVKVALARRLRQDTTMSLKWIARRLHMGSWTYVSNLLQEQRKH